MQSSLFQRWKKEGEEILALSSNVLKHVRYGHTWVNPWKKNPASYGHAEGCGGRAVCMSSGVGTSQGQEGHGLDRFGPGLPAAVGL